MNLLNSLTNEQRDVVHQLGLGSLLGFNCSFCPTEFYHWLAHQFDTTTRTLTLGNGFEFTITPNTVYTILGIPMGRRKLNTFCSPESVAYINDNVKKDGPTLSVKQLCAMIVPDMPLDLFAATFYLTSMQCFLCPNASQTQSSYYFDGILVLKELSEFDLCSIVLDWLVSSIAKFQLSKPDGRIIVAGGCSPVLVVSSLVHLETINIL